LYLGSGLPGGLVSKIVLMGNPEIWWASIPCLLYVGWNAVKTRDKSATFILAVFLFQWLPYVPITRVLFLYSFTFIPSLRDTRSLLNLRNR
jgi:dolichyl-phosphate-mannose--protein O-mannosyl transferase